MYIYVYTHNNNNNNNNIYIYIYINYNVRIRGMEQRYGTDPSRRYGTGVWNGGMERVWSRSLFRTSYFDLHPNINRSCYISTLDDWRDLKLWTYHEYFVYGSDDFAYGWGCWQKNNNIFLQPWRCYEMLHSNIFGKNEKYSTMCCQFEEHWHFNLKHVVNLNLKIYHKIFEPKTCDHETLCGHSGVSNT